MEDQRENTEPSPTEAYGPEYEGQATDRDASAFQWGDGYVGGRGYGGTNYDLSHGYRVGTPRQYRTSATATKQRAHTGRSPAARGGYEWGEERARAAEGPYSKRVNSRKRSDDEVRAAVEDRLFFDSWVDAEAITVEVSEGVVTLRGRLPSFEEVRYATDDAWEVDGVRDVRTELEVDESATSN